MRAATAWQIDREVERWTDRFLSEMERNDSRREEAFVDVEVAIKKLREARRWIEQATDEGVDEVLENKIASYLDTMDDLISDLKCDLSYWKRGE